MSIEFNRLAPGSELPQKRRTKFAYIQDKLEYDAFNLIELTEEHFRKTEEDLDPINFARRIDDNVLALKAAINKIQNGMNPSNYVAIENVREAIARAQSVSIMPTIRNLSHKSAQNPFELSPEQAASTLRILKNRFHSKDGLKRHQVVEWSRVKEALLKNPEALWSIRAMEGLGHEPDVYFSDENGFDIGTCSEEAPERGLNCVYDEEAAELCKRIRPDLKFAGNAVAMAKVLRIHLMSPDQYMKLQDNGEFDQESLTWLISDDIRKNGLAYSGNRYASVLVIQGRSVFIPVQNKSWRGTLRIQWADKALNSNLSLRQSNSNLVSDRPL